MYRTMPQDGRRANRDRKVRVLLAVTLAAHAGAAATVPWPGAAAVIGSAIGVACLVGAYLARPVEVPCRVRASKREVRK